MPSDGVSFGFCVQFFDSYFHTFKLIISENNAGFNTEVIRLLKK